MHGKNVELSEAVMRFGDFTAVHRSNLEIEAGEFFSILGPSGCGKTTILRMISGFIEPSEGRILIGGEDMRGRGPNNRPTALIFQNLALFPLMTVWENVAFGLEARGVDKATRRKRAEELLALVDLAGQGGKKPTELSGGQRQRVAVARALAVEPSVLLLDEPLSALDLKLRQHMRSELREIQRKTGVTFVFITHDQGEALTMSDRVAVMNHGRVEQIGSADEIYLSPRTPFVATFVGQQNVFRGKVAGLDDGLAQVETSLGRFLGLNGDGLGVGDDAMIFVRPERLGLVGQDGGAALGNQLEAEVEGRELEGPFINMFLNAQGLPLTMHVTNSAEMPAQLAGRQKVGFRSEDALVLRAGDLADE